MKYVRKVTYVYARKATLAIASTIAIDTHRTTIVKEFNSSVPSTTPCLAMTFKNGKETNEYGQIFIQKWYMFVWLTRLRIVGMKTT